MKSSNESAISVNAFKSITSDITADRKREIVIIKGLIENETDQKNLELRITNFIKKKLGVHLYVIECFQFYYYFQLAGILSFQKRYTYLKKILETSELFKKMWSQISLPMKFLKFYIRISDM
jgi:hypothetical protein